MHKNSCLIHSRQNLLLPLNFNRNRSKIMSVFPCLCHRVMTFNQEYYCTLLVTAETQTQPTDAIPVLLLAAYKQQPQTGSWLTSCLLSEENLKNMAYRQTAVGVHSGFLQSSGTICNLHASSWPKEAQRYSSRS